jgi:hypothetical protein
MATTLLGLVFFGGAAILFGWVALASLRQGKAWGLSLPGDRASSPAMFWSFVLVCAALALLTAGGGVAFALQ